MPSQRPLENHQTKVHVVEQDRAHQPEDQISGGLDGPPTQSKALEGNTSVTYASTFKMVLGLVSCRY